MALALHVAATDLPLTARLVYARLATSNDASYTCRQHSRNPSWPTCLLVDDSASGSVHLSLHTQISAIEDGLLGLVVLDAPHLRATAPVVLERKLANGAVVTVRVERVREARNARFTLAASSSRLRRRGAALRGRTVPLVLVIFRQAERPAGAVTDEWVPIFRAHGVPQGGSTYFDDADLDLRTACLGGPARTLRIALYRIDAERKFKLVAFFETAYSALSVLPPGDAVTQPLQGRYYDDQPGLVTFARVDPNDLRITVRFHVFNADEFLSSYSRPWRPGRGGASSSSNENVDSLRSRRLLKSGAVSDDRVEKSLAFDRPPPSSRVARRTPSSSIFAGLLRVS